MSLKNSRMKDILYKKCLYESINNRNIKKKEKRFILII